MKEQNLLLHDKDGKVLSVRLRRYQRGDEEELISCIREEYGDTYFKRDFYQPAYFQKKAADGHMTILVAQTCEGEIAGMMILKQFYPQESMCEIASQIFKKKYRGYGLAELFFTYGIKLLKSRGYSAAYCLPVVFHDITQRLLYRCGLRATGFQLNVFDMEHITHSYLRDRNEKHSQGIQIMALGKQDAGTLYLPEEHRKFCQNIYERLGVAWHMADTVKEENAYRKQGYPTHSVISGCNDHLQHSLSICIDKAGEDLQARINAIHASYPLRGKQTANILLNCSEAGAVKAYETVKKLGYFFTGLKPLCSEREYMVLHHPGEVKMYFEDYVLSEEFAELLAYVKCGMQK